MKKINSIGYGHRILLVIIVLLFVLPACLSLASGAFHYAILPLLMRGSLWAGGAVTVGFLALLGIEFMQDRRQNRLYAESRNTKVRLDNGEYECQACGNRHVSQNDRVCRICGAEFLGDAE